MLSFPTSRAPRITRFDSPSHFVLTGRFVAASTSRDLLGHASVFSSRRMNDGIAEGRAMSNTIDFDGINQAALRVSRLLLQELIPGGKFRGALVT